MRSRPDGLFLMCWHYVEEAISDALPPESESANAPELAERGEERRTCGVGFGNRAQRRGLGSPKSRKSQSSAYSSFLETLPVEQGGILRDFAPRRLRALRSAIASPTSWLNKHHLEYWNEFQRSYLKSPAPVVAPELPQKLKDAIAAGQVKIERYFSKQGESGTWTRLLNDSLSD